jgi:hypothetical protein
VFSSPSIKGDCLAQNIAISENKSQFAQLQGWSWYCPYHDTMGSGDTRREVLFMAGAHLYYFEDATPDDCDVVIKEHNKSL